MTAAAAVVANGNHVTDAGKKKKKPIKTHFELHRPAVRTLMRSLNDKHRLTKHGVGVICDMLQDVQNRVYDRADNLMHVARRVQLSDYDMEVACQLVLPANLCTVAIARGNAAYAKYVKTKVPPVKRVKSEVVE